MCFCMSAAQWTVNYSCLNIYVVVTSSRVVFWSVFDMFFVLFSHNMDKFTCVRGRLGIGSHLVCPRSQSEFTCVRKIVVCWEYSSWFSLIYRFVFHEGYARFVVLSQCAPVFVPQICVLARLMVTKCNYSQTDAHLPKIVLVISLMLTKFFGY